MEELRPDSGIVVDYHDTPNQIPEELEYAIHYNQLNSKESPAFNTPTTSFIDLMNYINPMNKISDREVIISLIEYMLSIENDIFHRFESTSLALNRLTRNCSMCVINKFKGLSLKIRQLIDFTQQLDQNDDDDELQFNHATFYTYLITLRMILNQNVELSILKVNEQIRLDTIEFKSLWHFYKHLNSSQCDYLVDKVFLLDSISSNFNECSIINQLTTNNHNKLQNYHTLVTVLDQLYLNLQFPNDHNRYLWILFLNCFKPTLKYLQNFLINGYPTDAYNEFYFENLNYQYESDFWSTCLVQRDPNRVPICLKKCWRDLINGLKSRLLMKYADEKFLFGHFSLYHEFIDDLFLNLGFEKKSDQSIRSPEPLTSNAFSYEYINQINGEIEKLFSSVESIDRTSIHTLSSSPTSDLNDDQQSISETELNSETNIRNHLDELHGQIKRHEDMNLNLIEYEKQQLDLQELNLYQKEEEHELDHYILNNRKCEVKQIKACFNDSLQRCLNKIIIPISRQVSDLFKKDYLDYLRFFNNYYLMQLEQHSFSLFFDTLFEKLIYDPIGFQYNLYSKVYDLRDFGFENTNLIIFLKFSETFDDDLIYFDIISRLNLLYKDLDWTSSTIINNDAQDFYNRSCKVLMKIKFIKWLTNNLPTVNRDFNHQRHSKLPYYHLFHRLFLIKHNLTIVLETLHSSILIKINSLQSDLYAQTKVGSNYEELVYIFQHYLQQVGIILHLDLNHQNEENPQSRFHNFIRKLCEKAIEIWEIWFSIEHLFYANFDENNIHKQVSKSMVGRKVVRPVRKIEVAAPKVSLTKHSKMRSNGSMIPRIDLPKLKLPQKQTTSILKKQMNGISSKDSRSTGDSKMNIFHVFKGPDYFDTVIDVNEISLKLDEINKFLKSYAEIFQG